VVEFHEITRRHGYTPIGWLDSMGLLNDRAIIGHGIFLDDHPSTQWHTDTDLARLAETGTTVAHCPTVFARRGITMKNFGRYKRRGVNMGLGTDTYPHNMLDEMRLVGYLARTQATDPRAVTTTEIFDAATIGGAKALGRDDIGRLAAGCRADIVLVNAEHPMMRPGRDPMRSLVYAAGDRALRDVYVDGQLVVKDGMVLTMDYEQAAAHLHEAQKRVLDNAPTQDWAHRPVDKISPPSFPWA
jgi:cytosine/adenosine deaminase-related metal-dependent hydrolase